VRATATSRLTAFLASFTVIGAPATRRDASIPCAPVASAAGWAELLDTLLVLRLGTKSSRDLGSFYAPHFMRARCGRATGPARPEG
jgi:hypothetical protein